MYDHLVKQNNRYKKAYLLQCKNMTEKDTHQYLMSKLNCCGFWYGHYFDHVIPEIEMLSVL